MSGAWRPCERSALPPPPISPTWQALEAINRPPQGKKAPYIILEEPPKAKMPDWLAKDAKRHAEVPPQPLVSGGYVRERLVEVLRRRVRAPAGQPGMLLVERAL